MLAPMYRSHIISHIIPIKVTVETLRAAQTRQMSSYGWRPFHRHLLTQDRALRYISNATGLSCRGDEGLATDGEPLTSVDGDARIWAEHIL
ncbi:hypothetical protein DY000_02048215 [Brassica cretica]|uniref:Uncharacterized protein n=1 Tax=Brassica cretica TaxID=69181 RepID=A0ABQ7EYR6_BRACR|nr:hypothetical protein DY000_02048215 [Brassica cretica]